MSHPCALENGHQKRRTQTTRQDGSALISVYTTDGVLRYQRDEAAETTSHYVELGGTLVAEVERPFAPTGMPTPSGPGFLGAPASYTISWTTVSNATSYQLQQQLNGGSWSTVYNGAGTGKSFSGMGAGSWNYRVRACNAAGCGGYSATYSVWVENLGGCIPGFGCTLTCPRFRRVRPRGSLSR